jgi:hypothetical protein
MRWIREVDVGDFLHVLLMLVVLVVKRVGHCDWIKGHVCVDVFVEQTLHQCRSVLAHIPCVPVIRTAMY